MVLPIISPAYSMRTFDSIVILKSCEGPPLPAPANSPILFAMRNGKFIRAAGFVLAVSWMLSACSSKPSAADQASDGKPALTPISFVTDWKAQAEHGGFYEALAEGLYEKAGLKVSIMQGGPGVNVPQLIAGGAADFGMG